MFKGFLLVLALGGSASATTIATVICDGNITSDPTFARCTNSTTSIAQGDVQVGAFNSFFLVNATAAGPGGDTSAQASISGIYTLTMASGTGGGFFLPCIGGSATEVVPGPGAATASASFGPFNFLSNGIGLGGGNICSSGGLSSALPFVDGVAQDFGVFISASASKGSSAWWYAGAGLGGANGPEFLFWDSQGNALANVSYTLTEIPEPGSFAFFLVAFLILMIGWRRSRTQN